MSSDSSEPEETPNPSTAQLNRFEKPLGWDMIQQGADPNDLNIVYREIFNCIPKEQEGIITPKELRDALSRMGEYVSEEQAKEIAAEIDEDGNFEIDQDEFISLIRKRVEDPELKEYSYKAFELFGKTKDGFLTRREVEGIMKLYTKDLSANHIEEMLSILPWDEEGMINYESFLDSFLLDL